MRRGDRLFLIIHALRGLRTALQARPHAATLVVSLCTVYREVADLQRSGVPSEGEADPGEHFIERPANNLVAYLAAMRSYYADMD